MSELLPVLNHDEHEALCRRCGVSCHMALEVGAEKYVIEEIHCRFLGRGDDGRYACTVYEKRFEVAPWCHTAEDALKTGNLAFDCPYTRHIPGYKGKIWASSEVRGKLIPIVRKKLIADGLPLSGNPDSALKILTSGGENWTYTEQAGCFRFHRQT
jgi:uncharacterized cysteine cluster protein YcgN (CxxCxxCC family)